MFDYKNFSVKEFAANESFQRWILSEQHEDKIFWEKWLVLHPEKLKDIEQAREILLNVREQIFEIHDHTDGEIIEEEINKELQRMWATLHGQRLTHTIIPFYKSGLFRAAASILLALAIGTLAYINFKPQNETLALQTKPAGNGPAMVAHENTTDHFKLIVLPDSSSVLLKKDSKIQFPSRFEGSKREVFLSGEAFFEVTKDKSRPFFVNTNDIITKVVGTSFTIRAYENTEEVKVIVKTGKVRVFKKEDLNSNKHSVESENDGFLLQQDLCMVFNKTESKMTSYTANIPDLQDFTIQRQPFEFDKTPMTEVFLTLEKSYGVQIISDKSILKNRCLTASLADEPLNRKMDMICKVFDFCYQKENDTIRVNACHP